MALVFATLALNSAGAFAGYEPLVVCGNEDQAGNIEMDNITIYRGGTYENQLVLRNQNIIRYFLSTGAVYGDEVNFKGEFIVRGLGTKQEMTGHINNRFFKFYPEGNGYTLYVGNGQAFGNEKIATFHFSGDCEIR